MIAAQALSAGAVLVTHNGRHYERIAAPLVLANWALLDHWAAKRIEPCLTCVPVAKRRTLSASAARGRSTR